MVIALGWVEGGSGFEYMAPFCGRHFEPFRIVLGVVPASLHHKESGFTRGFLCVSPDTRSKNLVRVDREVEKGKRLNAALGVSRVLYR